MDNKERVRRALDAATQTDALETGVGILARVAPMFRKQFPGQRAIIIADGNTWKAAGERVAAHFKEAGIECDRPYIFDDPGLHAEWKFVEELDTVLAGTDAIAVAVGSGTINDLAKLCSHHHGRSYMCVGTAASVDGYTSHGASITYMGAKQTFDCPAPKAVLADTAVMVTAPYEMTAAGYADLAAKVPAGADWILADLFNDEPIHRQAWDIVQGGLRKALSDPEGIAKNDPYAIIPLVDGLILSGFAMQVAKSSRPASGVEHMFSHLWDMQHHTYHGEAPSHGFKVGIGTLAATAAYEQMFTLGFAGLDIDRQVAGWPDAGQAEQEARSLFAGTGYEDFVAGEVAAKYPDKERLREELEYIKSNWEELETRLKEQLMPYAELENKLRTVGAPTLPEEIGISRGRLREGYMLSQKLRRRYTVLDLGMHTGYLGRWLDGIFGPGGVFEIG